MPQVKIYGVAEHLSSSRNGLIAAINESLAEVTGMAAEKIVYRFFPLAVEDLYAIGDRTSCFTILEITMFAGRPPAIKTQLIETIFVRVKKYLQIAAVDVEILLWEIPAGNYGLGGSTGEKLLSSP
jgi:phenylpyruvate tautomerase PptA (4-oxalocrotonate tautomerase family)